MPEFAAYYAGVECGNEYARAPHTVTFKHLGKTHIYAVTIEAATPDDAFAQLQIHRMTKQTAQSISKYVSRLTMSPGDVLLQAGGGPMHIRKLDGTWLTREVDE